MKNMVAYGLLICFCGLSLAADLAPYEKTCSELGFKKRTPAFGNCVLLLTDKAAQQRAADLEEARLREEETKRRHIELATGDGTAEHATCFRSGLIQGTSGYAECRKAIAEEKAAAEAAALRDAQARAAAEDQRRREEASRRHAAELEQRRFAQQQECQRMRQILALEEARQEQQRRQEALEYARMTPQQQIMFDSARAGQGIGRGLGQLFGGGQPSLKELKIG